MDRSDRTLQGLAGQPMGTDSGSRCKEGPGSCRFPQPRPFSLPSLSTNPIRPLYHNLHVPVLPSKRVPVGQTMAQPRLSDLPFPASPSSPPLSAGRRYWLLSHGDVWR